MKTLYRFLPFRFKRKNNKVLLVNDVGDFYFVSDNKFKEFIKKEMDVSSHDFMNLSSKQMVFKDHLPEIIELMATKYRTKKQFLYDFTALHMFVVTQRCNQKCVYCHALSEDEDRSGQYDMNINTARKCVELALKSPSNYIKFEFQGGEPLLNFDVVKEIVVFSKEANKFANKTIEFVICTNLTKINECHIQFIKDNNIFISTSLDGPKEIHDKCRRTKSNKGTYDKFKNNLSWVMEEIGQDKVSALMTVTPFNLNRLDEVIDEYIERGLHSIFLRMMNPYGSAAVSWNDLGYSIKEFIDEYSRALEYIINLNLTGIYFPEEFATLLLTKILTPFSTNFVDLQSPTGAGIGGVIYETNGDVFIADEARMLNKSTGNNIFCIGNAHKDNWKSIFCSDFLKQIIDASCIEAIPGCAWCVYQPYCGSDPIRNYIQFSNFGSYNSKSDFCEKHRYIFDLIFDHLSNGNEDVQDVFWSWVTNRNLSDIKL